MKFVDAEESLTTTTCTQVRNSKNKITGPIKEPNGLWNIKRNKSVYQTMKNKHNKLHKVSKTELVQPDKLKDK